MTPGDGPLPYRTATAAPQGRPSHVFALNQITKNSDVFIVKPTTLDVTPGSSRRAALCLRSAVMAGAVAVLLGGCGARGPTKKEQAYKQWNATRANVLLGLARDQYAHGNFADASRTCEEALAMSKDVSGLYVLQAKLDLERGELQRVALSIEAARKLAPTDAEIDYLAGQLAERWQKPEEALLAYEAAATKAPNEPAYLMAVAEMLLLLERPQEVVTLLEPKLPFFESSAPLRDLLAQAKSDQGDLAGAIDLWRSASSLAPEDEALRERWAMALMQATRWRSAAEEIERIIAANTGEPALSLLLALGECRLQLAEFGAARVSFQRAARNDERSVQAWLGVAKASLGEGELQRVEASLVRAGRVQRSDEIDAARAADMALLWGYVRLRQDRPSEAAASFAEAARLAPDDAMAVTMYGLALQRQGNWAAAERHYRRAIAMDPTEPLATRLLEAGIAGVGAELPAQP